MSVLVADIVNALEDRFPARRAEAWDRVGLLAGDPLQVVQGVTVALDPTLSALEQAALAGHNVLVTHHPAFLEPPSSLRPGPGAGGVVYAAVDAGIALVNAHTNLDRDHEAQLLIPERLGLKPVRPLETAPMAATVVTVYVPEGSRDVVAEAMSAAGAGRVGDYRDCSFAGVGTGRFTPGPESQPVVGARSEPSFAAEERLEMVCSRSDAVRVVAAAASAHPYEEPVVMANDVVLARNASALGMICDAQPATDVGLLAERASEEFGSAGRVWGEKDWPVSTVATTTGSGGSLIAAAMNAGVDVLLAGEVRYHDALSAVESGLAIFELGHDVSEWPLVALLEQTLLHVHGLERDMVSVLPATPRWWTAK